jgi:hypothetical protein
MKMQEVMFGGMMSLVFGMLQAGAKQINLFTGVLKDDFSIGIFRGEQSLSSMRLHLSSVFMYIRYV